MLRISRADIPSDEIIKYPDSFLKVPVEPYLELLGIEPNGPQRALINALNNPKYRFISAALSRRLGKTYISNIAGQVCSLVPGSHILIMSPNYSLSSISFDLQRNFIKHFELEVAKNNVKERIIELVNGSTIRMGSVSQVDSCVGRSYDLIIFDEAALTSAGEDAFNIALRPTLDKSGSKAIFISTPRGKNNWFSSFFDRGFSSDFPAWCSIHADYHENSRISEEDIAEARRSMSRAEFEQEYEASFNTFEGQVWNLAPENIVNTLDVPRSSCDCIIGVDWGFRDATAFVVCLYCSGVYYIVDEYKKSEKTTDYHAKKLLELIDKWEPDFIFTDSAAQQTKYDLAMEYGISMTNAKKSILDGIGYVESVIDTGKVIVLEDCKNVLLSIDQYQWDNRPGIIKEKPLHNDASHCADALRYALYSHSVSSGVF